jgi:hypothetical protein
MAKKCVELAALAVMAGAVVVDGNIIPKLAAQLR